MDHRGIPRFPGFVLTLIDDSELVDTLNVGKATETVYGLLFLVPDDMITAVVSDLDYREKGGYSRSIIKIKLLEDTPFHKRDTNVLALAYIGTVANPNFYLPTMKTTEARMIDYQTISNILSAAKGPSGPNFEYLLMLNEFLRTRSLHDQYLGNL